MTQPAKAAVPDDHADLPSYPQPRTGTCPFAPAAEIRELAKDTPLFKVRWWDGSTPWLITGPDELRTLLSDPRVSTDERLPGLPHWSPGEVIAAKQRPTSFLNTDGPEHAQFRKLLTSPFTYKNVNALRPVIQGHVDDLIDDMLAGPQPADLVQTLALPVPTVTICAMLGIPYEDKDFFQKQAAIGIDNTSSAEDSARSMMAIQQYMRDALTKRIDAEPRNDDICDKIATHVRQGTIDLQTGSFMAASLLTGGFETTANMIALGALAFLQNPDQAEIVRTTNDPKAIANAVEEMLRYASPAQNPKCRVALEDIDIAGQTIHQGEGIVQGYPFANWNGDAFPEPDRFDVTRDADGHLAFGYGPHGCIGQQLARVELQVVYPTLLRRIPTLRLAVPPDQLRFKNNNRAFGVYELPVTW